MTDWVLARLSDRLGVRAEPLALRPERRAEQARRLLPTGLVSPCGTQVAPLLQALDVKRLGFKMARVLSEVRPVLKLEIVDKESKSTYIVYVRWPGAKSLLTTDLPSPP